MKEKRKPGPDHIVRGSLLLVKQRRFSFHHCFGNCLVSMERMQWSKGWGALREWRAGREWLLGAIREGTLQRWGLRPGDNITGRKQTF